MVLKWSVCGGGVGIRAIIIVKKQRFLFEPLRGSKEESKRREKGESSIMRIMVSCVSAAILSISSRRGAGEKRWPVRESRRRRPPRCDHWLGLLPEMSAYWARAVDISSLLRDSARRGEAEKLSCTFCATRAAFSGARRFPAHVTSAWFWR